MTFSVRKPCCHMSTLPLLLQGLSSQITSGFSSWWNPMYLIGKIHICIFGWIGHVWIDTEGWPTMNYLPRTGSD